MYKFWFNMRKYETSTPTITGSEMVKMGNSSPHNMIFQDMFGATADIPVGHGVRVDVTNEPHFYCVPAATMYRGLPG